MKFVVLETLKKPKIWDWIYHFFLNVNNDEHKFFSVRGKKWNIMCGQKSNKYLPAKSCSSLGNNYRMPCEIHGQKTQVLPMNKMSAIFIILTHEFVRFDLSRPIILFCNCILTFLLTCYTRCFTVF